jgi:hypothetical protein
LISQNISATQGANPMQTKTPEFSTNTLRRCIAGLSLWLYCLLFGLLICCVLSGCSRGPKLVPVEGTVYLGDNPLPFGSVMFQPKNGPPARGKIQSDGSFYLTTHIDGDGATVGPYRVRVTCYEGQNPESSQNSDDEQPLGRLLIPKRYTSYGTSELMVEVAADSGPVELRLVN